MEPSNYDFRPNTTKSHSFPKTRNKLSSKSRVKLLCKREHHLKDIFSPISHCFTRNASTFVVNSVSTVCSEEDNVTKPCDSDPEESCVSEFSKQTDLTGNKHSWRSEQTVNATVCFNSESASETYKKLNYSVNKSSLDSSSVTVIQVADVEGKAVSANEECLQEFRNVTENGQSLTEASSDGASNKSHCLSSVKLDGIETESALECMNEVCAPCEDGTGRHFICPLCWKKFEKNQALILHMKGCAARHNVTTQQLLNALELQKRQAAERQALGLPDIQTTYTAKKSSKKIGSDNNLQLALALSASLQEAEDREQLEQDDCLLEAGLGHEVVEQQKLMWERFGFRKSHTGILAPCNSRHRSASKSKVGHSVLMRRTKEEREMLITEKVAIILMGEDSRPICTAVNISHNIHSVDGLVELTENLQKYQNKSCLLWNMTSVSHSEKELHSYYVMELTKFIPPRKVAVGSKLKRLSQIPGWSKTPERDSCSPVTKIPFTQLTAGPKEERETAEHRDPKGRQSFIASKKGRSTCKDSLAETLISDWKSVLNKKAMSDLTIYVEKDVEIPAHKLVLYVRCRAILKDVVSEVSVETNEKTSDMLLWVDVSYRAALAFLNFVYCGVTSKILRLEEDDFLNVKRLAERYHVKELVHYLRVVSDVRGRVNKSRNPSDLVVPPDNITDHRKCNSFNEGNPSDQCANSAAVPSSKKLTYSSNTFNSFNNSSELNERSVSSGTDSHELHESAEPGLCSRVIASPDLFVEDLGEPDMKPLTQEDSSSMTYLINMIHQSSLSQSDAQVNSVLMSSDKLSQSNGQISSADLLSDKLPQSNTQVSSSQMSSGKLSPTVNSATFSDCEVSRPSDMQIRSVSQSHDDRFMSIDTNLICMEPVHNNQDEINFFSSPLSSSKHTNTPDSISTTSTVKVEVQGNSLCKHSANLKHSPQSEICSQFQPSQVVKQEVGSAFDGINFFEHLLSDHHTRTSSTFIQPDVKERVELKRKHAQSDTVSDHCSFYTKKICSVSLENERIKTFTNKSDLNESCSKFKELENDTEVFDLTQSSTDSEPQDPFLIPPVSESVADTSILSEKNFTSSTECTGVTICNNLLMNSEDTKTSDKTSECKYFDSGTETRGEKRITVGQNKGSVEEKTSLQFDNKQISDEWDEFDEMCHASVPQIFSQCLTQLIASQSTTQQSPKSRTSSYKSNVSQYGSTKSLSFSSCPESQIQGSVTNCSSSCGASSVRKCKKMPKSMEDLPPVFRSRNSPTINKLIDNTVLAQLNESLFWRDENAPTLSISPKKAVMTDSGNILEHRTPIQKPATVNCLDTVTPCADYSTMKTPQLKKELKKYGLKPSLTKRQAKIMLRYIYDQLHPYITVSDSEDDTQMAEMESSPLKKLGADTRVLRSPVKRPDILETLRGPVRRNIMAAEATSHNGNLVTERRRNSAPQSDACSDSDDSLSSQERSSSSDVTVAEETFCEEFDICSQGDIRLSQDADLATVVHSFIISDPSLHQKVLLYEPIWIEQLHADLKANNFKFKLHQLMDYLDEQCITFRTAHGQHKRQKKKLMKEAKRKKSTKKKRNLSDTNLTSSSAVNSTCDR